MISKRSYRTLDDASGYLSLLKDYYSESHGFKMFYNDSIKSLLYTIDSPDQESTFFLAEDRGELFGHIAITIDKRLPSGLALFGFFECTDDKDIFRSLWDTAISFAANHGLTQLVGPVNSTTFYQYRFSTLKHTAYRPFLSEPIHRDYYYSLFSGLEKGTETLYYSGLRTRFESILKATEDSYQSVFNRGFLIEEYSYPSSEIVLEIYHLSNKIFSKNWMYLPISEDDFRSLYDSEKISGHIGSVYICRKDSEAIGFASTLSDGKSLIIKTLGVDPALQEQGIGNALVHQIHNSANKSGYCEVIYALIEEKNRVKYFTREDASILREYCAFNFKLKQ